MSKMSKIPKMGPNRGKLIRERREKNLDKIRRGKVHCQSDPIFWKKFGKNLRIIILSFLR
jgi:hypothetical protein